MVSSERMSADLFIRQPDSRWLLKSANRLEDVIELQSIDCRLALADIYEKAQLAEANRT